MQDSVNRRDFVKAAGTVAAAAALSSTTDIARAAETETVPKIRKAVKYGMVRLKGSLVEKFKTLKELGYHGIDIDRRLDHDDARKARDESGLIIHGVVSYDHWRKPLSHPDPKIRKEGLESFLGAIRDAHAYGGSSVLLVPAVVNKQTSYADAYKRSQEQIKKAIPLAEKLGIRILFENVWNNFLLSPVETARYIDEFESPVIGAYFDVGNVVRFGWPEHWIQALGKRIVKLDIKEYSRKLQNSKGPGAGFGVKLGDGDCDWPAVMKALDKIGYTGWGTAEVGGGGEERLREISERMDRILGGA